MGQYAKFLFEPITIFKQFITKYINCVYQLIKSKGGIFENYT